MTVEYLIRRTYPVKAGDTVLVHAAAGGVGLIQCQWLKHLGATVIGTVGSEEKAALARARGCDHPVMYRTEDFSARVMEITAGQGVPVVYDSIGADTLEGSLKSLARRGVLASFGNASGPITSFNLAQARAEIGLHHAAHPLRLQRDAGGAGGLGRRPLRGRARGRREGRDPPDLPAGRGRPGAPRPGGAQDHGLDHPDPLSARAAGTAQRPAPVTDAAAGRAAGSGGFRDPAFMANRGSPVHRWVPWIAGFSRHFVRDALDRYLPGPGVVLDPFAGVGTTLVEADLAGHQAIGFEINPYAAFAAREKLAASSAGARAAQGRRRGFRRVHGGGRAYRERAAGAGARRLPHPRAVL